MLTKWAKKFFACAKVGSSSTTVWGVPYVTVSGNTGKGMIEAKTINGTTKYIPFGVSMQFNPIKTALVASGNSVTYGVAFGSGTTPATENDYTLEHQVTGFTASTPSIETVYDTENWKIKARMDYSIANDTGADITISEIGLFDRSYSSNVRGDTVSTSAANTIAVLFDRTVLAQPITIPDGGAATVRYEFVYDA